MSKKTDNFSLYLPEKNDSASTYTAGFYNNFVEIDKNLNYLTNMENITEPNLITKGGNYVTYRNAINSIDPSGEDGKLFITAVVDSYDNQLQQAYDMLDKRSWTRTKANNVWSDWKQNPTGLSNEQIIFGDLGNGKSTALSNVDVSSISDSGFYSTDDTCTGLPSDVSNVGSLIYVYGGFNMAMLLYKPSTSNELFIAQHENGDMSSWTSIIESKEDIFVYLLTVDGEGSGLDSDLLDGMHASTTSVKLTVVSRDNDGNFSANIVTVNGIVNTGDETIGGTIGVAGNASFASVLNANGGTIASTATTFNLLTGVETINFANSAISLTIGGTTESSVTDIQTGAIASGSNKIINIGTGGLADSDTTINIGSDNGTIIDLSGEILLPETTSIGGVSSTEIGYLNGVTSPIQSQLNSIGDITKNTSFGIIAFPTTTRNTDGTLVIGTDGVINFKKPDGTIARHLMSTGATLNMTNDSINYVYASYNAGSPIYKTTLDRTIFTSDLSLSPLVRVAREGATMHFSEYDAYGEFLSNKLLYKDILLNSFQRQEGLSLSTSEGRVASLSSGVVWFGVQMYNIAQSTTGTTSLFEYYLNSGAWIKSANLTQFDSTYYSNGVNRQTLGLNKWVAKYFFRDIGSDDEMYYVHGNEYNSEILAESEELPSTTDRITKHAIYVGKIIIQQNATLGEAIQRVWDNAVASQAANSHNDLSNRDASDSHPINAITGLQTSLDSKQPIDSDLTAISSLSSNGIIVKTATGAATTRSIEISGIGLNISNGNGINGNPTISSNATSDNVISTIVSRDTDGNFSANIIDIVSSLSSTSETLSIVDNTVKTLHIGGETTEFLLGGHNTTETQHVGIGVGITSSGATKTIDIGTGALIGANTNVNIGATEGISSVKINGKLTVSDDMTVTGSSIFKDSIVAENGITGTLTGTALKSLSLVGGNTGSIPYQSAVDSTSFISAGTSGQFLRSNGDMAPSWADVSSSGSVASWCKESVKAASTGSTLEVMIPKGFSDGILTGFDSSATFDYSVSSVTSDMTTDIANIELTSGAVASICPNTNPTLCAIVTVPTITMPANTRVTSRNSNTSLHLTLIGTIISSSYSITGNGVEATATFPEKAYIPFAVGATITLTGTTPSTYSGSFIVTKCTKSSVSWNSTETVPATPDSNSVLGTLKQPITVGWTGTAQIINQITKQLRLDGINVSDGDRVLVKDIKPLPYGEIQSGSSAANGIYVVTAAGSTTTPWILTRASDADTATKLIGAQVSVLQGSQNSGKIFKSNFTNSGTLNVSSYTWSLSSGQNASILIPTPTTGIGIDYASIGGSIVLNTGSMSRLAINSMGNKVISAIDASTYGQASTLYIGGAPSASTNVTISSAYALYVETGETYLGGGLTVGGVLTANLNQSYVIDSGLMQLERTIQVKAATTSSTIPSTLDMIDDYTPVVGDLILLASSAGHVNDGIYVVNIAGSIWTRYSLYNTEASIIDRFIKVFNGTNYKNTYWTCVNKGTITLGTTALKIQQQFIDNVNSTIIPDNSVTNTKMAQMQPMTVKANNSTQTANPQDLTVAQMDKLLKITQKAIVMAIVFGE